MIQFSNTHDHYWRNMVTRTLLVVLTVVLIVLFLPRSKGKMFHYDEGKPWMYGQLIANFDFPVFKTDEALKRERDSIMQHFQPYFNVSPSVEEKEIALFRQAYKGGIPGLPPNYVDAVAKRLHELYQTGIMSAQQYSKVVRDSDNVIHVVTGKQAVSQPISKVYSTIGAYEHLFMDPVLSPKRDVLQQCNLNEYIEPNLIYDKDRSETEMNDLLSLIPQASGMVLEGQRIIDRGDIVDAHTFRVLSSFEQAIEKRNATEDELMSTIVGQSIYVFILIALFTLYLALFRKDYFEKPRAISLLYTMLLIFPLLTSLMMEHTILSVYILPFAMAPIFIRVFMDSRTAFIAT